MNIGHRKHQDLPAKEKNFEQDFLHTIVGYLDERCRGKILPFTTANGKQKEWEERYNAKRKAKMEAAKAAIRAEDMEKGIFTTVSQLPRQEPRKATLPASAAV